MNGYRLTHGCQTFRESVGMRKGHEYSEICLMAKSVLQVDLFLIYIRFVPNRNNFYILAVGTYQYFEEVARVLRQSNSTHTYSR